MHDNTLLSPFNSLQLISHENYLNDLINLYNKNLLPNALLLKGKKGIGKHTLVNHFLNYVFTKDTKTPYNVEKQLINKDTIFYNSLLNDQCSNVINLSAGSLKGVKIDNIRQLKITLSKTTLDSKPRFIIIDEVERLNLNCSNALLKILEEPTENNFFILIDNNQSKIIETITSRCINHNVFLSLIDRKKIIENILQLNSIKPSIDLEINTLTPGLYLEFNDILNQNNISINTTIIETVSALLMLYKKSKKIIIVNLCSFIIEQHFHKLIMYNDNKINILIDLRNNIIKSFNDLVDYNLNVTSVLNSVEMKLKYVE